MAFAGPATRKLHGHWIDANHRLGAVKRDDVARAIDLGVQHTFGGIEEVSTIVVGLKSDNAAAEQSVEQLPAPRTRREITRTRPRNMPERNDRRERQPLVKHARRKREVIVLHQDERLLRHHLLTNGIGKPQVDRTVHVEISRSKNRLHVSTVTQWPESFIREPVVVPPFLASVEPDAPEAI